MADTKANEKWRKFWISKSGVTEDLKGICHVCGQILNEEWHYCPRCGEPKKEGDLNGIYAD